MRAVLSLIAIVALSSNSFAVMAAGTGSQMGASVQSSATASVDSLTTTSVLAEFNSLRERGNDALYDLDYQAARESFQRMTKIAPDHPAGYVYLANNFWLETLNAGRRLSSSLYSGGSFYEQDAEQDRVDPKREREFNDLVRRALAVADLRRPSP